MSEPRALYNAQEPFREGETVYHRIDGAGTIVMSEWGDLMFQSGDGWRHVASVATDLSRTPWEPAAPTQDDRDRLIAIYEAAIDAIVKNCDDYEGFGKIENLEDFSTPYCLADCEWTYDEKYIPQHAADCPLDAAFKAREARK